MTFPAIPHVTADASFALFLDVDGTLLEIAPTPNAVVVPDSLKELLASLSVRLDGALALVSGRSIVTLDRLFSPLRLAAAGIHGSERREASGCVIRPRVDLVRFAAARDALAAWTSRHPGTLLEDKGSALALHYRLAPNLEDEAHREGQLALERLGGTHELQRGKSVVELRPTGHSKGSAISAFLRDPPFLGRSPIFIGDDITDEAGFAIVNKLGGMSIRVGPPAATAAAHRLEGVDDVIEWLRDFNSR